MKQDPLPGQSAATLAPRTRAGHRATSLPGALLALALLLTTLLPFSPGTAAQEATPLEIASGPLSERTLGLTGQTRQSPDELLLFGYLGRTSGLTSQDLFTGDAAEVGDARFTFSAEVALQPPTNRADTSAFAGEGTFRVYLAPDGGADWSDPTTFSRGDLLAEYDLSWRETLQRQAPQVGVLVGDGTLTQTAANAFTLDGISYRFGAAGLESRVRFTGALVAEPPAGATLAAIINGHAEVTRRPVTVVRMGATTTVATPVPDGTDASVACALEPWLSNATAALDLAEQGAGGLDLSQMSTVDDAAVIDLADQLDAAIATLRGTEAPAEASDANRLLVTALSTSARGLRAMGQAAADGDDATFSQASLALADGQSLLAQSRNAVSTLAETCPAG